MPPVVPAAIAGITAAASGASIAIAGFSLSGLGLGLFVGAANLALGFVGQLLTPKPRIPNLADFAAREKGITQLVRASVEAQRVIYGERMVSGPLVFAEVTGPGRRFLHLVIALAGHEVEAIGDVFLNDEAAGDLDAAGDVTTGRFAGTVRIKKHLGAAGQLADADLVGEAPSWTDAHRLRGIAYLYVRLTFDRDVFPTGIPNVKALVRGRKILDPRNPANPPAWSDNAALCLRDYLVSDFGLSADPANELDDARAILAADICDEDVALPSSLTGFAFTADPVADVLTQTVAEGAKPEPLHRGDRLVFATNGTLPAGIDGGGPYYAVPLGDTAFKVAGSLANARAGTVLDITGAGSGVHTAQRTHQPRYTLNAVLGLDDRPIDIVSGLVESMTGALTYTLGRYAMFAGAYTGPPTATLSEKDLRGEVKLRPRMGRRDLHNAVRGTFTDRDNAWQPSEFPPVTNAAYEQADGGDRLFKDVELRHVTDTYRAQRLAKLANERDRQAMIVDFPAKLTALDVAVMDTVALEIAQLGFGGARTLTSAASSGVQTIEVDTAVRVATRVTLDPGGAGEETFTVDNVAGSGPYTLTLDGALANAHGAGETVAISKEFEVIGWTLAADGGVDLVLKETAAAVYAWDPDADATTIDLAPNTDLPRPFDPPAPPTGLALDSGGARLLALGEGSVVSRIRVSWTAPDDIFVISGGRIEVQVKETADAGWSPQPAVAGGDTATFITPVRDGVSYDVRIRSHNSLGVAGDWVASTGHVVTGKTAAPPDVAAFNVVRLGDGTRRFDWSLDNLPADVRAGGGFRIRFSTDTAAAWEAMTPLHDGLLTAAPYETNALAAGAYLFGIKAVDSSGNESAAMQTIVATLGDPRLRNVLIQRFEHAMSPAWPGLRLRSFASPANRLLAASTQTIDGLGTNPIDSFGATAIDVIQPNESPLVYITDEIDLGEDVTFTPVIGADVNGVASIILHVGAQAEGGVNRLNGENEFRAAQSGWLNVGVSVAADTAPAPDGPGTADGLIADSTAGSHYVAQTIAPAGDAGERYFLGIHARAGALTKGRLWVRIRDNVDDVPSSTHSLDVDLSNGALVASSGAPDDSGVEDVGSGWFFVWIIASLTGGENEIELRFMLLDAAGSDVFAGNGSDGLLVWGAHVFKDLPGDPVTARYARARVEVAGTNPKVTQMTTILDAETQIDEFNDVDTSDPTPPWFNRIAAGHFEIGSRSGKMSSVSFATIRALQNVGGSWSWELVSKSKAVNGQPAAEFKVRDASGALADALIDVELKGPKKE
ncbi:MAG: phage tail protein [Alphaproteobacteria bacterium]